MKLVPVLLLLSLSVQARDLQEVLRAVEQRYNKASTLEAQFEQRYLAQGRPRRAESGTLSLRKPGRMRWQYTQPSGKLFICDGKWIWFYSPAENRAERAPLKEADDFRAPLAFLLGRLDFRRTFGDFELRESGADSVIIALPKSDRLPYTRVEFQIAPDNSIRRLLVRGVDGADMEFLFTGERLNVPVSDSAFRFTPPAGAEIVDAAER